MLHCTMVKLEIARFSNLFLKGQIRSSFSWSVCRLSSDTIRLSKALLPHYPIFGVFYMHLCHYALAESKMKTYSLHYRGDG